MEIRFNLKSVCAKQTISGESYYEVIYSNGIEDIDESFQSYYMPPQSIPMFILKERDTKIECE